MKKIVLAKERRRSGREIQNQTKKVRLKVKAFAKKSLKSFEKSNDLPEGVKTDLTEYYQGLLNIINYNKIQ